VATTWTASPDADPESDPLELCSHALHSQNPKAPARLLSLLPWAWVVGFCLPVYQVFEFRFVATRSRASGRAFAAWTSYDLTLGGHLKTATSVTRRHCERSSRRRFLPAVAYVATTVHHIPLTAYRSSFSVSRAPSTFQSGPKNLGLHIGQVRVTVEPSVSECWPGYLEMPVVSSPSRPARVKPAAPDTRYQ